MRATWRPLPAWPYPRQDVRKSGFAVSWAKALDYLDREIELTGGSDPVIGVVATDDQFSLAGTPKANFKVLYRGAEVGFDAGAKGRLSFHTDAFPTFHENLRAITLAISALRSLERYGIGQAGEQFAGFALLGTGGPDAARGKKLVERAGGMAAALKAHHPDQGGRREDLADVLAWRELEARGGR